MSVKIKTFGDKNKETGQLCRLEEGFLSLNCEIISSDDNIDLIYAHGAVGWNHAIILHHSLNKKPILLLKVLDLGRHTNPDYLVMREKLKYADLILSNSEVIKNEIKKYLCLDSYTVFDCIKDVYYNQNIKKDNDFLAVGRLAYSEKRFFLIKELCLLEENKNKKLVCCDSSDPNFGSFLGIVSDEKLNYLYNSSKFVLCVSREEGLLLPMLEGFVTGCIPIICNDMSTAYEFAPKKFICEPNIESINSKIKEIENNYLYFHKICLEYGDRYKKFFNKKQIAQNILNAFTLAKQKREKISLNNKNRNKNIHNWTSLPNLHCIKCNLNNMSDYGVRMGWFDFLNKEWDSKEHENLINDVDQYCLVN